MKPSSNLTGQYELRVEVGQDTSEKRNPHLPRVKTRNKKDGQKYWVNALEEKNL